MAGVIIASPKNSAAPKTPRAMSAYLARADFTVQSCTSAISAMIPPSPPLSARMISSTYLIETMMVIAQKISEITP